MVICGFSRLENERGNDTAEYLRLQTSDVSRNCVTHFSLKHTKRALFSDTPSKRIVSNLRK